MFGGGDDLAGIDLPNESALLSAEERLLHTFNEKLDALTLDTCSCCREQDFDLTLRDGECKRCREDHAGPTRKWSAENGVNPCEFIIQ